MTPTVRPTSLQARTPPKSFWSCRRGHGVALETKPAQAFCLSCLGQSLGRPASPATGVWRQPGWWTLPCGLSGQHHRKQTPRTQSLPTLSLISTTWSPGIWPPVIQRCILLCQRYLRWSLLTQAIWYLTKALLAAPLL